MRSLVFDPHLDTLGGGERYAFAVARLLAQRGDVTIAGHRRPDAARLTRLGFDAPGPIAAMSDAEFTSMSRRVDAVVAVVTRLPPPTCADRSVLVVQFPFPGSPSHHPRRWMARARLLAPYRGVVYSEYVPWLARRWQMDADVVPPPVPAAAAGTSCPAASTGHGEPDDGVGAPIGDGPMILSVGRFFATEHHKRHDALIEAFRSLHRRRPDLHAELVLVGGLSSDAASQRYLDSLRRQATGLPVALLPNAHPATLERLYRRASCLWHAAGLGRPARHPERAEHFGMAVVEAMAHGVVPLVYDDGGLPEIVTDGCGVRWRSVAELVEASVRLLDAPAHRAAVATQARTRAQRYSPEAFAAAFDRVLATAGRSDRR